MRSTCRPIKTPLIQREEEKKKNTTHNEHLKNIMRIIKRAGASPLFSTIWGDAQKP